MLGIAKTFGMTDKQALYDISYKNAVMYSRTMPMPDDKSETDRPLYDDSKDACNPDLFTDETFENEEIVRI